MSGANKMVSTKWTYHKEKNFASNSFIFLKILLQFILPVISAGVLFEGAFISVSILKKQKLQ